MQSLGLHLPNLQHSDVALTPVSSTLICHVYCQYCLLDSFVMTSFRKHEKKPPTVSGFDMAVLDTWAAQQQGKDSPLEGIGAFGAALLGGQDSLDGAERDGPASLVSAKEERDLQTLLEMFAMGVGDVEQFQSRLQDELAALEVGHAAHLRVCKEIC